MRDVEEDVATRLGAALGTELAIVVMPAEGGGPRPAGRAALGRLLRRLGDEEDPARLVFPHPRVSLTHGGELAIAVGVVRGRVRGVGIDAERTRRVDPEAARFFLDAAEQAWAHRLAGREREEQLLRLWTVKEALFKATPGNPGTILADYSVTDPAAAVGTGGLRARRPCTRYASTTVDDLVVTVALNASEGGER